MAEAGARIRLYEASDEKLVKFTIGKAAMEGLAAANRSGTCRPFFMMKLNNFIACFHPFTLSLWVALSCIMIQLLDWWPKPEYGLLGYFPPLPAFGCWGAVMLYLIDWYVDVQPFAGTPHEFNSIGLIAHPLRMRLKTCCEGRMSRTLQSIIGVLPPRAFSSLNMTENSLVLLPLMLPGTLSRKTQ